MKKLHNEQILSILELGNNPLISYSDVSVHSKSGNINIMVVSNEDSSIDQVENLIYPIFPDASWTSKPFVINRDDGTSTDIFTASVGSGINLTLHMLYSKEIALAANKGQEEFVPHNFTTFDVVEEEKLAGIS